MAMRIRQIRSADGTGTLSYFVIDEAHQIACLIDPNDEDRDRLLSHLQDEKLRLTCIIDTHTHADHVSAAGELRAETGAETIMHTNTRNKWKIVDQGDAIGIGDILRANAQIPIDRYVDDGNVIEVGDIALHVLFTPGHTDNHISLLCNGNIFSGDLLLIGQAGRSDLPGGDAAAQHESLCHRILPLPDDTRIHPGHDYANREFAVLGDEKKANPFLSPRSKGQYLEFVREFFPPLAELTAAGGKMTLQCGTQRVEQKNTTLKHMPPFELHQRLSGGDRFYLLDVREPMELMMTGAIEGVHNISIRVLHGRLGELPRDEQTTIVCVCQSGSRSLEASHLLQRSGFRNVVNMPGGVSAWRNAGLPLVRNGQWQL
jgi:glyoxylase-like metal-dependent hydrolase (beta-lactamase superfamily II)/rhodanese-related sulfurtransferase